MKDWLQTAAHPEYHALIKACRAGGVDTLPYLVLADWLEEHGHPIYAEYIRRENGMGVKFGRRYIADDVMSAEQRKLKHQHYFCCKQYLERLFPHFAGNMEVSRGFVSRLYLPSGETEDATDRQLRYYWPKIRLTQPQTELWRLLITDNSRYHIPNIEYVYDDFYKTGYVQPTA